MKSTMTAANMEATAEFSFKAKFHRDGNIKLGTEIATWSTLKGNTEYFIPELGIYVIGTCGKYCEFCKDDCYVEKSYRRYTARETGRCSVKLGHARNTIALRQNAWKVYQDLHDQIARARKPFYIVRLDQSGEIENDEQLAVFCKLAEDFPEVKWYIYTKAFEIVIPALLEGKVPENLTVLISVWHECGIAEYNMVKHLPNVKAFVVVDGFDYEALGLHIQTMCMAYDIKGKMNHEVTCFRCEKCFNRLLSCKVIGCYKH